MGKSRRPGLLVYLICVSDVLKDALNKYYEKERVTAKWIVKGEQASVREG